MYVLSYWDSGKYNYVDLKATELHDAEIEATGYLEDNAWECYMRNEWQVEEKL